MQKRVGIDALVDRLWLLTDEPVVDPREDGLELRHWARVISRAVISNAGPLTIGVFGGWGTGKTSILGMAERMTNDVAVEAGQGLTTVRFDPWLHEGDESPLPFLIAAIISALESEPAGLSHARGRLASALRAVLFGLTFEVETTVPAVGGATIALDADKAIERYESLRTTWVDEKVSASHRYTALRELRRAGERGNGTDHKVVVFIDDLDRCLPDQAIRLLQEIRLVFAEPGFLFVLAVDREILLSYLGQRFKKKYGRAGATLSRLYLDKMIQIPLWLPRHKARFGGLVDKLLASKALRTRAPFYQSFREILPKACGHNPRQLVRFLNNLIIDEAVYGELNPARAFPLGGFLVARALIHRSEEGYRALYADQALCLKLASCTSREEMSDLLARGNEEARTSASEAVAMLAHRADLMEVLLSEHGEKWLRNWQLRTEVDNFLSEEREFAKWRVELRLRARKRLGSADEGEVLGACQSLGAVGEPEDIESLRDARRRKSDDRRLVAGVNRAIEAIQQRSES